MIGQKPGKDKTMYESNIYIKNYATIKKYAGDIGVQLDKFDNAHHLKHTRWHAHSTSTGAPSRPVCRSC